MDRGKPKPCRSDCPLNAVLETLGDSWSLLVVRDLMFKGRSSYRAFLEAEEGIATNILSDRLRRLERWGVIERRRDPDDGRRIVYGLTEKGLDLAPVLLEMIVWGAKHYRTAAPPAIIRRMTEDRERFLKQLRASLTKKREPTPPAARGRRTHGR